MIFLLCSCNLSLEKTDKDRDFFKNDLYLPDHLKVLKDALSDLKQVLVTE